MSAVEEHKPVEKRRALGRGLDSLLPSGPRIVGPPAAVPPPVVIPVAAPPSAIKPEPAEIAEIHATAAPSRTGVSAPLGQEIFDLPLDLIDENPYQTRRTFDESALTELAESIKANGLAQPVVVRPAANGRYV